MMEKIDFVLPWVDSSDTQWQMEKDKYDATFNQEDKNITTRFRDMNTLKYVLRSIEKNCPWFNKIYLITIGHTPDWLDVSHPKIELVTHEELYFDKSHLPVFSSSSIEMNLANIKGLSEQFIYLNDDTMIINPLEKTRFFQHKKPVDFLSHGWLPRNRLFEKFRGSDTWIHSLNNNLALINNTFSPLKFDKDHLYHESYDIKDIISNFLLSTIYKKFIWLEHWHHPQPYLMKTLQEVYSEYHHEMMLCSSNKFRSNSDLTQYIYRYWQLAKQNFTPHKYNDGFVAKISSLQHLQSTIEKIKQNPNVNFVCFNDQMNNVSEDEFKQTSMILENYLESIFPDKASFERQ